MSIHRILEKTTDPITVTAYSEVAGTRNAYLSIENYKDVVIKIYNNDDTDPVNYQVRAWSASSNRANSVPSTGVDVLKADTAIATGNKGTVQLDNAECYTHVLLQWKKGAGGDVSSITIQIFGRMG